jgi:hypothetical protein
MGMKLVPTPRLSRSCAAALRRHSGEALQAVVGDYDGNRLIDISLEDLNASGLLRDELEGRQFERALRLEANGVPPKRSSPPSQALGTRR